MGNTKRNIILFVSLLGIVVLFVSLLIFVSSSRVSPAGAEEETQRKGALALEQALKKAAEAQVETEIGGLVIDQTETLMGETFYETFVIFWEAPPEAGEDYNIVIVERASASWGSWIWVVVNDEVVYQDMLKPRSGEVEEKARNAVGVARNYLSTDYQDGGGTGSEDLMGDGY